MRSSRLQRLPTFSIPNSLMNGLLNLNTKIKNHHGPETQPDVTAYVRPPRSWYIPLRSQYLETRNHRHGGI